MSVNLIKQPHGFVPAHNDVEFYASSDQTAQPNFTYYVLVTIVSTSDSFVFRVPPDGSGNCYFNACSVTRKFVNNFYAFGLSGFSDVTDGFQDITVNIGEEYGSTPTIHSGSDFSVIVWNACLKKKERASYFPENYLSTASDGFKWLNSITPNAEIRLRVFQDLMLQWLTTDQIVDNFYIKTYNSAGTLLNDMTVLSPLNSAPSYGCFNVGVQSINNFQGTDPGAFTFNSGSAPPINPATIFYYTVDIMHQAMFTVRVGEPCNSKVIEYELYYLNRFGAFDFQPMQGNHKNVMDIQKTFYQGLLPKFQGSYVDSSGPNNVDGPNPQERTKKAINISYEQSLTLLSQPLDQDEINNAVDMVSSPVVFIQNGSANYTRYSQEDTSFEIKDTMIEKIVTIEAKLKGEAERRQFD